jgi:hypothetical protein
LKPFYIQGHIDGKLISRMLMNNGAAVNLMPYSVIKKLGKDDDELIKTNIMLNGMESNSIEAQGLISMEFTIGSKSLTTAFFIVEKQGNYSAILSCHWIHANRCVPSTLHQFLIQWINDEIEVVHTDMSTYIAVADIMADWQLGSAQCLLEKDLTGYDSLSISKEGFVPVSVKRVSEARLGNIVFQ